MTSSPVFHHVRSLLILGLPLVGANLAQAGLHVVDTIMLGWYGVSELAAAVLAVGIFFVLFVLGSGFSAALMGRVAAALGSGDVTQARRDTRMTLWLSLAYAVLIMPFFYYSGTILRAAGQEPDVADLAQSFLRIAMFGMFPALVVATLKACLGAFERTRVVLIVTVLAVVVNAGLNWIFIFGRYGAPEMGIQGAAIGSVVVQVISAVVLLVYVARVPELRRFGILERLWRPDWQALWIVLRLGLPVGLTGLAETALFQATALMMGWLGKIPLAAHGIALEIAMITFMVHMGLSSAATIRAGRAYGRGDVAGLRLGAVVALTVSLVFGVAMVCVFFAMPERLVGAFLDPTNPVAPQILAVGVTLLAVAGVFQIFDAIQVMALGLLRGVQDTRVPMWVAVICYWAIGIPSGYFFGFVVGWGPQGLWIGLVLGLAFTGITLIIRFWRGPWLRRDANAPA